MTPQELQECADFWERYSWLSEAAQTRFDAEGRVWLAKMRAAAAAAPVVQRLPADDTEGGSL